MTLFSADMCRCVPTSDADYWYEFDNSRFLGYVVFFGSLVTYKQIIYICGYDIYIDIMPVSNDMLIAHYATYFFDLFFHAFLKYIHYEYRTDGLIFSLCWECLTVSISSSYQNSDDSKGKDYRPLSMSKQCALNGPACRLLPAEWKQWYRNRYDQSLEK